MPNRTYAKEWLEKAYHDLGSATILYEADHYTDSIGVDLHYALEKTLKALLAYENEPIPRSHDLIHLYLKVKHHITLSEDERNTLNDATDYHIEIAYPTFEKSLPPREEIKNVHDLATQLLDRVCHYLAIPIESLK